jgi:hypothetical protein
MIYSPLPRLAKFKLFEAGLGLGATGGGGAVPVNTVPPTFIGSPVVGNTLTVNSTGTWNGNPTSFLYQWYNWFTANPIAGATSSSYVITNALLGQYIACYLIAVNANGDSQPVFCRFPEYVGPVTAPAPTVRGSAATGTLTSQATCTVPTHQTGDYLVVSIYYLLADAAPSAPSGWSTLVNKPDGSAVSAMQVFGRFAASSLDTFVSGQAVGIGVYNSYAIQGAGVGDDASLGSAGTATPITAPSVSPTGSSDLLLSFFGAVGGEAPTISAPSAGTPTTSVSNSTVAMLSSAEVLSASGATTPVTAAVLNQLQWVGVSLAIE